jgi:hypothetical protein
MSESQKKEEKLGDIRRTQKGCFERKVELRGAPRNRLGFLGVWWSQVQILSSRLSELRFCADQSFTLSIIP